MFLSWAQASWPSRDVDRKGKAWFSVLVETFPAAITILYPNDGTEHWINLFFYYLLILLWWHLGTHRDHSPIEQGAIQTENKTQSLLWRVYVCSLSVPLLVEACSNNGSFRKHSTSIVVEFYRGECAGGKKVVDPERHVCRTYSDPVNENPTYLIHVCMPADRWVG